jgi:hypothetical protein
MSPPSSGSKYLGLVSFYVYIGSFFCRTCGEKWIDHVSLNVGNTGIICMCKRQRFEIRLAVKHSESLKISNYESLLHKW